MANWDKIGTMNACKSTVGTVLIKDAVPILTDKMSSEKPEKKAMMTYQD